MANLSLDNRDFLLSARIAWQFFLEKHKEALGKIDRNSWNYETFLRESYDILSTDSCTEIQNLGGCKSTTDINMEEEEFNFSDEEDEIGNIFPQDTKFSNMFNNCHVVLYFNKKTRSNENFLRPPLNLDILSKDIQLHTPLPPKPCNAPFLRRSMSLNSLDTLREKDCYYFPPDINWFNRLNEQSRVAKESVRKRTNRGEEKSTGLQAKSATKKKKL